MEQEKLDLIAMYLPQFYRTPENDEWWGEGFTEWTAVKKAKTLFHGHHQPRAPLDNNYYILLNKDTMEWQASLMHQYGIDAMCFYHYYFKNGRKILEKPVENLLKWKDIDMPFCFCWANETWARSWTNVRDKNVWANTFEDETSKRDGILMLQNYGREEDWVKHFNYLLPFFKDKRYVLKDGKPVFLFHRTSTVYCLDEMLGCWRWLARENGLGGLYVIGSNCQDARGTGIDARLQTEPGTGISKLFKGKEIKANELQRMSYDEVWCSLLETKQDKDTLIEGFVGYDDTPRRGMDGFVVESSTPFKFGEYLARLIAKNMANEMNITFVNAWNEWGEGMYLEPDEENKYGYLEAIQFARGNWKRYVDEYSSENTEMNTACDFEQLHERTEINLQVMNEWLVLWENGLRLSDYLIKERNIKEVIIHGYGVLGRHLYNELKNGDINVRYVVEQNKDNIHIDEPVYLQEEVLSDPVGVLIIVTAVYYYDEIAKAYRNRGFRHVVSIEALIKECKDKVLDSIIQSFKPLS